MLWIARRETFIVLDSMQTLLLRAITVTSVMLRLIPDKFRRLIVIRLG